MQNIEQLKERHFKRVMREIMREKGNEPKDFMEKKKGQGYHLFSHIIPL